MKKGMQICKKSEFSEIKNSMTIKINNNLLCLQTLSLKRKPQADFFKSSYRFSIQ